MSQETMPSTTVGPAVDPTVADDGPAVGPDQWQSPEGSADADDPALQTLTRLNRVISAVLIAVFVVAIPINLMSVWAVEKDRRKCGLDWILWIVGSETTFEQTLLESLEKSREEFERQQEESRSRMPKFELKEFDANLLIQGPRFQPESE